MIATRISVRRICSLVGIISLILSLASAGMGVWARANGFLFRSFRIHVVNRTLTVDPLPLWYDAYFDIKRWLWTAGVVLALVSVLIATKRRYGAAALIVAVLNLLFFTGRSC